MPRPTETPGSTFADPWTDLPLEPGPQAALEAARAGDLARFNECAATGQLATMVYGRQALQVLREVPTDPKWELWHAGSVLLYGLWHRVDDEWLTPASRSVRKQFVDVYLSPLSGRATHSTTLEYVDSVLSGDARGERRATMRTLGFTERGSIHWLTPRSASYLRLEDTVLLAWVEMLRGRLELSLTLAERASSLGVPEDHQRIAAADLITFVKIALGGADSHASLRSPAMLAGPRGPSPIDTCLWLLEECLLSTLVEPHAVDARAIAAHGIAARLGSPRLIARAEAWRSTGRLLNGDLPALRGELPAQLQFLRTAAPGLRALPLFLSGVVNQRTEQLFESARLSRATGQGWLELAALTWLVHLGAGGRATSNLHRLLRATGWRTIPLVPRNVAAAVASTLASEGSRSTALVEFAVASRDEKAVADVAAGHLEDPRAGSECYGVAAAALARVGRPGARALLRSVAQSHSPAAAAARAALTKRLDRVGLSEREGEVLRLAASGRTNAEIASTLVISPHTVARHVENSRTKLGAANRAEAVARWLSLRGREDGAPP